MAEGKEEPLPVGTELLLLKAVTPVHRPDDPTCILRKGTVVQVGEATDTESGKTPVIDGVLGARYLKNKIARKWKSPNYKKPAPSEAAASGEKKAE